MVSAYDDVTLRWCDEDLLECAQGLPTEPEPMGEGTNRRSVPGQHCPESRPIMIRVSANCVRPLRAHL